MIDPMSSRDRPEILILLSGGLDSMACAHFYLALGRKVGALFIDYGQRATEQELVAAESICRHFALELQRLQLCSARLKSANEIRGRNLALAAMAVLEAEHSVRAIALGIHAGTEYPDCSPQFVSELNALLAMQRPSVEIVAPFLNWTKGDIVAYAQRFALPIHITYSCEHGVVPPCGLCRSCGDRGIVNAGS